MEDAAIEITVNDLPDIGTKEAVLLYKAIVIDLVELLEMILNALIIRGIMWFVGSVNSRCVGHVLVSLK